jgi:hypothetical protein
VAKTSLFIPHTIVRNDVCPEILTLPIFFVLLLEYATWRAKKFDGNQVAEFNESWSLSSCCRRNL